MENKAIVKYNGGMGAVLCNTCGCIVRAGAELTEEDKACLRGELALYEQYCLDCQSEIDYLKDKQLLTEEEFDEKHFFNTTNKMKLKVINDKPMPGNEISPDIKNGEEYELIAKFKCNCSENHYDIGLKNDVNYVECYKCRETLPPDIRWCHSSRFVEVNKFNEIVK